MGDETVKKEMIEKRQGSRTEDKSGREDLTVKENTLKGNREATGYIRNGR